MTSPALYYTATNHSIGSLYYWTRA